MARVTGGTSALGEIFRTVWARGKDVRRNEVSKSLQFQLSRCLLVDPRLMLALNSFAWAELLICTAMLFRRFNFELCNVNRKRDIDVRRDCFLGQPSHESEGLRVKVHSRTD